MYYRFNADDAVSPYIFVRANDLGLAVQTLTAEDIPFTIEQNPIMCGGRVVWISRDLAGHELLLTEHRTPPTPDRAQR